MQNAEEGDNVRSRDFITQHSYYLHDHSNRKETIISSKKHQSPNYSTIQQQRQRVQDYRQLESGSDCDEVSPMDILRQQSQNKAMALDPNVLTESLADFFDDIMDGTNFISPWYIEESIANRVSKTMENCPVYSGEAKEESEVNTLKSCDL